VIAGIIKPLQLDYYCKPETIKELNDVKTSAEAVMIEAAKSLDYCYDKSKPLIPQTNSYIPLVNLCD
jgi:hypothetical protein